MTKEIQLALLKARLKAWSDDDIVPIELRQELTEAATLIESQAEQIEGLVRVLGLLVDHSATWRPNAIGPDGLFCRMCGLNSNRQTHAAGCLIGDAQTLLASLHKNQTESQQ